MMLEWVRDKPGFLRPLPAKKPSSRESWRAEVRPEGGRGRKVRPDWKLQGTNATSPEGTETLLLAALAQ